MTEKLVVIGNGMAPGRMLEYLLAEDPDRFAITIFNAEPRVNYNRLMLSPVLSGEKTYQDIITHDDDWYATHNIELLRGEPVVRIDTEGKTVTSASGVTRDYDKLVIATGSSPIMIPLPGHDLPGVQVYRDLDDVQHMLKVAEQGGRAVVIGGGLLGLEAAAGLKQRGMDVCVVHLAEHLMEKQLDGSASYLLQQEFERRGIEVRTSTNTKEILGDTQVSGVRFEDGTQTDCNLLVMAVGIRPETTLASKAGLAVNHGIRVDDSMCTSVPNIYALGECVEHAGKCYGLVAPLYEMSKTLATTLLHGNSVFAPSVTATQLKVNGVKLFSAGEFSMQTVAEPALEDIILCDARAGIYKRVVLRGPNIAGVVLYGDTDDGHWYFDLLKRRVDVSDMRECLIFGPAFQGGATLDPTVAVAALRDNAESGGCSGMKKPWHASINEVIHTEVGAWS